MSGEAVDVDATVYELALQYRDACRSVAMWSDYKRQLRDQITKIMGRYTYGDYNGRRIVTVIRTTPKRFNTGAFAEMHPGLYEDFRVSGDEEVRISVAKDLPGGGFDE